MILNELITAAQALIEVEPEALDLPVTILISDSGNAPDEYRALTDLFVPTMNLMLRSAVLIPKHTVLLGAREGRILTHPFDPDWTIHPGVTFNECARERGIALDHLDPQEHSLWKIIHLKACSYNQEIDYKFADEIVELLGEPLTNPTFWVNLSNNYQAGLRAGKKDITAEYDNQ